MTTHDGMVLNQVLQPWPLDHCYKNMTVNYSFSCDIHCIRGLIQCDVLHNRITVVGKNKLECFASLP